MNPKNEKLISLPNFFNKPPDWRWQKALDLVANGKNASSKRDDPATCDATRFLRALNRSCTVAGVRKLKDSDREIMAALQIYQFGGPPKVELECRLLARQSLRAISRLTKLSVAVIETYSSLFFDISDRLQARGYIDLVVIGMRPDRPPTRETLMKMSAYHHGPHAVDAWLDYLRHANEAHDLATVEGRRREAIELLIATHNIAGENSVNCRIWTRLPGIFGYRHKPSKWRSIPQTIGELQRRVFDQLPWECLPLGANRMVRPSMDEASYPTESPIIQTA